MYHRYDIETRTHNVVSEEHSSTHLRQENGQ